MTPTENQIHKTLGDTLALLKSQGKIRGIYFPVPNGAADLGPLLGARLKRAHKVHPGVSDWLFASGSAGALGLELKTANGRQSDDQKEFEEWCAEWGVKYALSRSVRDSVFILVNYGFISEQDARPFL